MDALNNTVRTYKSIEFEYTIVLSQLMIIIKLSNYKHYFCNRQEATASEISNEGSCERKSQSLRRAHFKVPNIHFPILLIHFEPLKCGQPLYNGHNCWPQHVLRLHCTFNSFKIIDHIFVYLVTYRLG